MSEQRFCVLAAPGVFDLYEDGMLEYEASPAESMIEVSLGLGVGAGAAWAVLSGPMAG